MAFLDSFVQTAIKPALSLRAPWFFGVNTGEFAHMI